MKAFITVLAVAFVPCAIEGVIEWAVTSFIIGWIALVAVAVTFAGVLFSHRIRRKDKPRTYYDVQKKNSGR